METKQVQQEIQFIKEMIEKTKRSAAESGTVFIIWTIFPILAILGMYSLIYLKYYQLIWLNWVVFIALGSIFTYVHVLKQNRKQKVKTYTQMAADSIWMACVFGFILLGFVFPFMGIYSSNVIPIMMSVIAGIGVYATGGITEWNLLKWCGLIWWLGALAMGLFIQWPYGTLFLIPVLILGYLVPGLILNKKYRQQGVDNG